MNTLLICSVVPGTTGVPMWRVRGMEAGLAPITASIDVKHNSTRVSVPGCRGRT